MTTTPKPGDTIKVRLNFGTGPIVTGIVDLYDPEGKNGQPVIDFEIEGTGEMKWAYLDQIVAHQPQEVAA